MTSETLQKVLASNIKERRKELGFSQAKLAELANISLSMLVDIENRRSWVSIKTLVRLCAALQIEVSEIFETSSEPMPDCPKSIRKQLIELAGEILRDQKKELYKMIDKNYESSIVKILESTPHFDQDE